MSVFIPVGTVPDGSVPEMPAEAADIRAYILNHIAASVTNEFIRRSSTGGNCEIHLLRIRKSLGATELVSAAGLMNSYLASLERTLNNGYEVVAFKLAPYVSFDPRAEINVYLWSVSKMAQSSFLGVSEPNHDDLTALRDFNDRGRNDPELVRVPFSPFISSCLTTTLFFWVYLAFVFISQIRARLLRSLSKLLPKLVLDKSVFTSVGLVLSAILSSIYVFSVVVGQAWTVFLA